MQATRVPATVVVGVRLPFAVAAELRKKAADNDRKVSSEMRAAVSMYLESTEVSGSK
jgi:hypothetical protein